MRNQSVTGLGRCIQAVRFNLSGGLSLSEHPSRYHRAGGAGHRREIARLSLDDSVHAGARHQADEQVWHEVAVIRERSYLRKSCNWRKRKVILKNHNAISPEGYGGLPETGMENNVPGYLCALARDICL
jgi:hypothetical protein